MAGVVGPMGSSSFSLPNVERALTEMEGVVNGPAPLGMSAGADSRKPLSRSTARPVAGLSVPGVGAPGTRSQVSSPTLPSSPSPTPGGQTQHEVLQNFFQSLLSSKDRASGATSTGRSAPKPAPVPATAANGNGSSGDPAEGM